MCFLSLTRRVLLPLWRILFSFGRGGVVGLGFVLLRALIRFGVVTLLMGLGILR